MESMLVVLAWIGVVVGDWWWRGVSQLTLRIPALVRPRSLFDVAVGAVYRHAGAAQHLLTGQLGTRSTERPSQCQCRANSPPTGS